MLKIIGRLIGLQGEDLKYNREMLVFMIIASCIFFVLGISHTKQGSHFIYANKLKVLVESKSESTGVSKEDIDKMVVDYKETVPINAREFEIDDIKDRVDNYIHELKDYNNSRLNQIIEKLEDAQETDNKETLISNLKSINLEEMLSKVSKVQITKDKLESVAKWQENIFLSIVYFSFATVISFTSIIIKVVCGIKLFKRPV